MTSNRWERIKELFAAAAELSPADRSSFLIRVCAGDTDLLEEVERLLREHDSSTPTAAWRAMDFLETGNDPARTAQLFDFHTRAHTFAAGELVSGRFRIIRFIGRGGMGEVYEAEDLELGERIALKTIRPEIASEEGVIARFKQEIQLSRKVTHPNVCRIFDIERHKPASHTRVREEVTYLTMELLAGETLADRLHRTGRMTADEALPTVLQIIDGLQAAHRAGIVHGDLKSANVMLVPSNVGPVRAVVTDFGLARLSATADKQTAGPAGGSGTPAYMAPEQVERGIITTAADIYSLGVVMFEMVTGNLPFVADTPTLVANKRLNEDPPSPRNLVSDLDHRWERAILRCLQRDPVNRYASAADVALALRPRPWPRLRAPRRRTTVGIGAAVILLVLSAVGYRAYRVSRPEYKTQLAQARLQEGLAHEYKGELKQAEAALDDAQRLYAAAGNRAAAAEALTDKGDLLTDDGDFARANVAYQSALAIAREIGAQQRVGLVLQRIGILLHSKGDIPGARKSYESALEVFRQIDDKHNIAATLKDMALVAANQAEGQKDLDQALSVAKEGGDKVVTASTLDDLGDIFDAQGNLTSARKAFEDELSLWRDVNEKRYLGYIANGMNNLGSVLYEEGLLSEAAKQLDNSLQIFQQLNAPQTEEQLRQLGRVRLQEDELAKARQAFEEALPLAYKSGDDGDVASSLLCLARLLLEENRPSDAEKQARQAEERLRDHKNSDDEAQVMAVLGRSLADQRKLQEAQHALRAPALHSSKVAGIVPYGDRLLVRVTVGRALVAAGDFVAGAKWLESALADASRLGYLGYQLEARLGLGEIQMKSGRAAEGRAHLAAVENDAKAKGFKLIARKAQQAMQPVNNGR